MSLIKLIRYRFFLFAGLLPYFLGQAVAFDIQAKFDIFHFWLGFAGIFLVLIAVELFNEHFDSKEGGDRIFAQQKTEIPNWFFKAGISSLGLAFIFGLYLALQTGWPVLLFCFLGFLGAYFYVGPPIRWAYHGLGEIVIGLCYGPFMILGSYYIQSLKFDFVPFFTSLICGLSIFSLAVLNEIPDYYQDMLVGKRNIVVKLGKKKAFILLKMCLTTTFILITCGTALRIIPYPSAVAVITFPWLLKNIKNAEIEPDNPKIFLTAVNTAVITHTVIALCLVISFLVSASRR